MGRASTGLFPRGLFAGWGSSSGTVLAGLVEPPRSSWMAVAAARPNGQVSPTESDGRDERQGDRQGNRREHRHRVGQHRPPVDHGEVRPDQDQHGEPGARPRPPPGGLTDAPTDPDHPERGKQQADDRGRQPRRHHRVAYRTHNVAGVPVGGDHGRYRDNGDHGQTEQRAQTGAM
jgi:hypothetical protein